MAIELTNQQARLYRAIQKAAVQPKGHDQPRFVGNLIDFALASGFVKLAKTAEKLCLYLIRQGLLLLVADSHIAGCALKLKDVRVADIRGKQIYVLPNAQIEIVRAKPSPTDEEIKAIEAVLAKAPIDRQGNVDTGNIYDYIRDKVSPELTHHAIFKAMTILEIRGKLKSEGVGRKMKYQFLRPGMPTSELLSMSERQLEEALDEKIVRLRQEYQRIGVLLKELENAQQKIQAADRARKLARQLIEEEDEKHGRS